MKRTGKKSPACIQYVGLAGITSDCKDAVMRLLQYGDRINRARILSSPMHPHSKSHGFLLTINEGDLVAVKAGFASGYGGEGPNGFSFILELLRLHKVEIEEYEVGEDVIDRLDMSSLTNGDIEKIDSARRSPNSWYDYISERHMDRSDCGTMWREFSPVIPLAIIDSRITDLALNFSENPDKSLLTGYRRLEDIVRKRTGINEHGHSLFSKAFHGEKAKLDWKELDEAERIGRANLFTGTYMAYRNPRAHRELRHDSCGQLMEFLLLNHLFVLEKTATEREEGILDQPTKKKNANRLE
jgi:hypothetical protein